VQRTTQPTVLQTPEFEIDAAMGAAAPDKPVASGIVAKQDKVFAEQPNGLERPLAAKLLDQRRRLPIAAQQRARRRFGPGLGYAFIVVAT
jgi:hypothetical protein